MSDPAQPDATERVEKQDVVRFYESDIVAMRLADGRVAATVSSMCTALGLQTHGQIRRMRADDVLKEHLSSAIVQTAGGPQKLDVLAAAAIPTWLTSVQVAKVAENKRERILAFKRQAADVLYRHFAQQEMTIASTAPDIAERPVAPQAGASSVEWMEFHRSMALWYEREQIVDAQLAALSRSVGEHEQRIDSLESRIEGVEEVGHLLAEMLERVGPPKLSTEHQQSVQSMVSRLHDITGLHPGTIHAELKDHFHVGSYKDIKDSDWHEVVAWFDHQKARRVSLASPPRRMIQGTIIDAD